MNRSELLRKRNFKTQAYGRIFYYSMLALLLTHEMDATQKHEWRILPFISSLPEELGRTIFLVSHVPLIVIYFVFDGYASDGKLAIILSGFAIIHTGLHWLFRNYSAYEFNTPLSIIFIYGAGAAGVGHILSTTF